MAKQNIYDNDVFFEGYKDLRNNELNANSLFEIPALFSLLPDLEDQRVLDLGCGFGEHCLKFIELGAIEVVGIDISEKMLEVATKQNNHEKIKYLQMAMEDISSLDDRFDIVISSLAFHYVKDYDKLIKDIYKLLNNNGILVFSCEHPLVTAYTNGQRWTKDDDGNKLYLNLNNYGLEGERKVKWFVDDVIKYHRTFETLINILIINGFNIEKIIEPKPTKEILNRYPEYYDLIHKPDFILFRAKKSK